MGGQSLLRRWIKAGRKRGALSVKLFDLLRLMVTADGRARLFTLIRHRGEVHQLTPHTSANRYPELFDFAAAEAPDARHILSFGCSSGEELLAIRARYPAAEIVGAEINPRSRRLAARRTSSDPRIRVTGPHSVAGQFDLIFALAVFQREPHKVEEMEIEDLSGWYPFNRFDAAEGRLVSLLKPGGLLCVVHSQYRIEDSSSIALLEPLRHSPAAPGTFFGRDGRRLTIASAPTCYRKRG